MGTHVRYTLGLWVEFIRDNQNMEWVGILPDGYMSYQML